MANANEYQVALEGLFGIERVNHGDPDEPYEWEMPGCGTVKLHLAEGNVHLMAQHVWQSSLTMADEMVRGRINIKEQNVLELGAGAALPSIVARRLGAKCVVTSDYPEVRIVENMQKNIDVNARDEDAPVTVKGFKWGEDIGELTACLPEGEHFDTVLLADTLWLEDQHPFLLKSCRDLLEHSAQVPNFKLIFTFMNHDNGRGVAKRFFQLATEEFGMHIVEDRRLGWKSTEANIDDPEESDASDPESYGPVYLKVLARGPSV